MKLSYSLSSEDLLAFSEHHSRASPAITERLAIWRWLGTAAVFVLVVGTGSMFGVNVSIEVQRSVALGIAAAYFVGFPYLQRRSTVRQIGDIYPDRDVNRGILGNHELEILPESLVDRTAVGEHRFSWTGIDRIEADDDHAYIYVGTHAAHVVPKAQVTEGNYEAFVHSLQQNWLEHHSSSKPAEGSNARAYPILERSAGIVILIFGLGLGALALWIVERQLSLHGSLEQIALVMCGIFGLIAAFCTTVGYRLLFHRPNRHGSLLSPSAWVVMAGFFGLIGLMLLVLALYTRAYTRVEPTAMFGFFAWLCWQAGQLAKRKGRAGNISR